MQQLCCVHLHRGSARMRMRALMACPQGSRYLGCSATGPIARVEQSAARGSARAQRQYQQHP